MQLNAAQTEIGVVLYTEHLPGSTALAGAMSKRRSPYRYVRDRHDADM
jgi:hypothetical protein